MKTFAITNRKGGVGKTTTAINLAYVLATGYRLRVLLIDADAQGNASSIVDNLDAEGLDALIRYGASDYYPNLIYHTEVPGLDLLPAGEELGDLDLECMTGQRNPDFWVLKSLVDTMAEDDVYDVVVIDCPPYFSLSCLNAITAADSLIIPLYTDAYSLKGMAAVSQQIESIRAASPNTRIAGCLVTKFDRSEVSQKALNYLRNESKIPVFRTVIRSSEEKVRESTWVRQATNQHSPFCNTSRDYREWVQELVEQEGMIHGEV